LVQAFLKKWWVESDFTAPNLPLQLRWKGFCYYPYLDDIESVVLHGDSRTLDDIEDTVLHEDSRPLDDIEDTVLHEDSKPLDDIEDTVLHGDSIALDNIRKYTDLTLYVMVSYLLCLAI
jgi:hypothetical protein